jgi:NAD-dependent DNA ligase
MQSLIVNDLKKYEIHDKIIELKKSIETSFIKMGGFLKLVRDNKLYKEKGCETFEEYLGIPELGLNRSTVYSIIGVWEDFVESGQPDIEEIAEIGYTKLDRIRQFKNDDDFEEWIYKAKTLSLSDLGAEIRETKNPEKTEIKKSVIMEVTCPHCGKKFEVLK